MAAAVTVADDARLVSPPNPWVGAAIRTVDGVTVTGSTGRPGQAHAEVAALGRLRQAGAEATGATVAVTLEPCSHQGRTPPCVDALVAARVRRVIVAVVDPDPRVAGRGVERLRRAGIEVTVGEGAAAVETQLAPYLHQRRTGRPYVVLKLASTLDGATAAADGTSQWITGAPARADAHLVRAESDAIVVGAGTVRADNPRLTVRGVIATDGRPPRPPLRVVLGSAPADAAVRPCLEYRGDLGPLLDDLAGRGVLQVMVEGGAHVAAGFHRAGLVDRYVFYLAPALMGGDDGRGLFTGPGAPGIEDITRLRTLSAVPVGDDLRLDLIPEPDAYRAPNPVVGRTATLRSVTRARPHEIDRSPGRTAR
ncbi:MAG: bifunctional diaminohydroxyphosphoribosylaminopyrimidine deaminase/5-amino-6-(5-phosphoribosylamino)uracil reductase RibD [Acidimicrobiales bacterium]